MRFEQAFKEARNSGDKTFEFEGKSYSTRMAGEGGSSKKSVPLPPKRDIPRVDDPEKSYPSEEASPRGYYNQKLNDDAEKGSSVTVNSDMKQGRYGTVRSGFYRAGENDVQAPEKPPTTGRLRTVGQNMVEKNAGFPVDKESVSKPIEGYEDSYRKGGMVKKKSGGSVRGAGIAQRGQGKMRMC